MSNLQEEQYLRRLRQAVASSEEAMPGRVEHRVRASLRAAQRPGKWWSMAALVTAGLAVGFFVFEPDLGQMETLLVSSALRPGLADHIHCTLHRGLMRQIGPMEDPQLVAAVSDAIPEGYRVAMCHRCQFRGRPYIHVALTDGESKLVSLIVTRKQEGEGMAKPTTSRTVRFAVSGSETHDHLVYVVSGLENQQNETLLAALEPKIQKYLQITPQKM